MKYLWYRLRWKLASYWLPKAPLNVDIELTNQCNLACPMCPHGMEQKSKGILDQGMMEYGLARRAVAQAAKIGAKSIKFNFRGEPGLYKDLPNLVNYAKTCGILETQINTNGTAMTPKNIKRLIDAGIDRVIFSIDGATKRTYEKIRIGAKWEKVTQSIDLFHVKPVKIRIQMVRQGDNDHEVRLFKQRFSKYGEVVIKNEQDRGQGTGETPIGRVRCSQPFQRLVVAWNGDVYPCCNNWDSQYILGNLKIQTLKELWNCPRMNVVRNVIRDKQMDQFEFCKNCSVGTSYRWAK